MPEPYRRPNSPYWWYDMTLPDGTRKRGSTKRTVKSEARAVMDALYRKALDRHQLGVKDDITLGEAVKRYLAGCQSQADYKNLVGRCRKLVGELEGKWGMNPTLKLSELSTGHVESLRAHRLSEGAAQNTIDNEVKVLSRIYHLARDVWKVALSPEPVRFAKFNPRGKLRYFTPEEEARILAELDPNRPVPWKARNGKVGSYMPEPGSLVHQQMQDCYDLAIFLLDTGARYSEVSTFPWVCADTIGWEWIDLYRSKNETETRLVMTDRLRAVLQRRRTGPGANHVYIFPGYGDDGGKDAPRGRSTRALRAAIERAGCNAVPLVRRYGRATVHTFRDTFASRLVQNGVTLYEVQMLLGHSDPRQTQKYAKLVPDQTAAKAASVLDSLAAD